jgi:hypothetical protein
MKKVFLGVVLVSLAVSWVGPLGAQQALTGPSLAIYSGLALVEEQRTLAVSAGENIYLIEDLPEGIVPDSVIFRPEQSGVQILEQEFISSPPTLRWRIYNEMSGELRGTLSYLVNGVTWAAYYTAILTQDEDQMALQSWVTLQNTSGRAYQNARIVLIAGELQRETTLGLLYDRDRYGVETGVFHSKSAEVVFETRPSFEYHEYKLTRLATLKNNQTLQMAFLSAKGVPLSKHYVYEAALSPEQVRVELRFVNDEASSLGVALPAGAVRLYKRAEDGTLRFIGESTIGHTPKNEEIVLVPGIAFDLKAERVLKDRQLVGHDDLGRDIYRETYEIKLRNQKDSDVVIEVREKLSGEWKIVSAKPGYEKLDANTVLFEVSVPANGTATVKYTVEWKNR